MQTDKRDEGDAEKSDVIVVINCYPRPKGQLWKATLGDVAVLHHYA